MADSLRIVEVGPRDGLQNEAALVPTATKVALIDRLGQAGLGVVEAGAFVSPKWVPQMADSAQVLAAITPSASVRHPVLVPNLTGMEQALATGLVRDVAVFAAASQAFSQRNINCTIEESLDRFVPVMERARAAGVAVRGYVSCVLGCPYEGAVDPGRVAEVAARLHALGCEEISLGDTIGVGTPAQARALVRRVARDVPPDRLALHFHDTYGQALANILACLEEGVRTVDSAVAGLGGCPYAKGATGNVATEDVLYMAQGLGMTTGVDLEAVADIGAWISHTLGRANASRAGRALIARRAP